MEENKMAAEIINEISEWLQKGRAKNVKSLVEEALEQGIDPKEILNEGLLDGMMIVGAKFKRNEVFVPEVLVAARAMTAGLTILEPKLVEVGNEPLGKAVIGTVKGDLHDIGKNLVAMMLKGAGFEIIDAGTDVDAETFIAKAEEVNAVFGRMLSPFIFAIQYSNHAVTVISPEASIPPCSSLNLASAYH